MKTYTCPQCKAESDTYQPICSNCDCHQLEPDTEPSTEITLPWSGVPERVLPASNQERSWQGQQVGNFQILKRIARGGFGEVYQALDIQLDRQVAIKFLKKESASERPNLLSLKHEAKAASALNHPNICTIYELGEIGNQVYIVMELLDGNTLKKSLPKSGFDLETFLDYAIQMATGLQEAHNSNIIHRDIKPGNIQITSRNQLKILDFGLAKRYAKESKEQLTVDGHTMGTLHYMSPEQVLGETIDFRTDMFSLGIVFYQMLTGVLPFKQDSVYATMDDIVNASLPPIDEVRSDIPRPISQIVKKMLAKEPEKRYANMSQVLEELRAFETKIHTPKQRPTWPLLAIALLPLVLIGGGLLWRSITTRPAVVMAIQPFQYQGPSKEQTLPDTITGLLFQSFQSQPKITTVPLMTSRELDAIQPAPELAAQLGVGTVLGGRFDVEENHYRLLLWLHSQNQKAPFWSQTYQGELGQLFTDFQTIKQDIFKNLKVTVPDDNETNGLPAAEVIAAYQKGMREFENQKVELDTQKAYQAFQQALELDSEFGPAHAGLSMTYWVDFVRNGNVDHVELASREANIAISKAPNRPEGFMAAGMVALGRGRTTEALDLFRKAQDLAPADESIAIVIGNAYAHLNRMEPAERMYQKAVGLRPGFWIPYLKLGRLYFRFNKPDQAAEMFQKFIELNPNSDTGYNNLAAVYMSQGNFQEAAPLLALGLKYNPSHEAHSNLGFVYFTINRFDDAAEQFRKAIELSPNDPINHGNLGDALRHAKRVEEANQAYQVAIENLAKRLEINPRDWDQKSIYAMYLASAGQCEESARQLEELTGRFTAERHYYAAISYALCKNGPSAKKHIHAALSANFTADIPTNMDLKPYLDDNHRALLAAGETDPN